MQPDIVYVFLCVSVYKNTADWMMEINWVTLTSDMGDANWMINQCLLRPDISCVTVSLSQHEMKTVLTYRGLF